MPKKAITKGLSFSRAFCSRSIFSKVKISVKVRLNVSSIFCGTSLGSGLSTNSTFKSSLIFSITSTEALFSNNANSKSQNNSSNFSAEIFLVVNDVLTLPRKDCFSSGSSDVSTFVSVVSTSSSIFSSSFLLNNLSKNDFSSLGSSSFFLVISSSAFSLISFPSSLLCFGVSFCSSLISLVGFTFFFCSFLVLFFAAGFSFLVPVTSFFLSSTLLFFTSVGFSTIFSTTASSSVFLENTDTACFSFSLSFTNILFYLFRFWIGFSAVFM